MTIALGSDHAGFELKEELKHFLSDLEIDVKDFGPHSSESVDYPDFVHPLCSAILEGQAHTGILICGTGNGVAMTANKYSGIRCGLCWNEEIATFIRQHNDANILALPGRFISLDMAKNIVRNFLDTEFEGGRHARRIGKITPPVNFLC